MLLRLRNAAASMSELNRHQERTANNLAQANTTGYQRDRAFTEVISDRVDEEGNAVSLRTTTQWADTQPGALEATGNPLDVALGTSGFFAVTDAAGATRYTRAGRFTVDAEGTLRSVDGGFAVQGADGPIQLPLTGGTVAINAQGEIAVDGQPAGALRLVQFAPDAPLERLDGATFATDAAPLPLDAPDVRQGFLEASNVNPLSEMTDMITHFRLFESQQKMLQTTDQALGHVTRDLGTF